MGVKLTNCTKAELLYSLAIANLYDIDLEQVIKAKEAINQIKYPSTVLFEENR